MEMLTGFPLLMQQTLALLKKNCILCLRHKKITFIQLFSSIIFMALMFGIKKINNYSEKHPVMDAVPDPKPVTDLSIPPCEDMFFIKVPCYDFVWSGGQSGRIDTIVSGIMANNPGRPIPFDKVKSFQTKEDLIEWLHQNPMLTCGALHFEEMNATVISYGTVTNSKTKKIGRQIEDPTFKYQMPLQLAASREIGRSLIGDPSFSWQVGFKEYAHPAYMATPSDRKGDDSAFNTFLGIFFLAAAVLAFVFQINYVVLEKELKHRQAMTVMGLFDTAYWSSWIVWNCFMTLISSLFTALFGLVLRWNLFLNSNFLIVLLLFFIFQFNLATFGLMITNFIRKSSSTTSVGLAMFLIGIMTSVGNSIIYSDHSKVWHRALWSLFPPNLFFGGLVILQSASKKNISWNQISACDVDHGEKFCYPLSYYLWRLIATFFLWIILMIYLDNVFPNYAGSRKSVLYFLKASYWTGKGEHKFTENVQTSNPGFVPFPDDESVIEEENSVKQQAREGILDPDVAVQFRALTKKYNAINEKICCFHFSCKTRKPFFAVEGLWMNIPKDQLFCLLGPNGAGKTTSISCLTGITTVSSGDALVYGQSIQSAAGLQNIRRMMGVCAQFDTLWDVLSAVEHLKLFASIKGLHKKSHESEAKKLLEQVKLTAAANVRSCSYSGGMKRRLSFAISLIGNPRLVILDEPTTGMDPVARRHIWNVIESAKQGRSIILTTHSMEEADVLSDRIGIMVKGRLRCIGNSTFLKSKFGTGFTAKVSFPKLNTASEEVDLNQENRNAVKDYFKQHLNVVPKEEEKYFLTFAIQSEKEELLHDFFDDLEQQERMFGILNTEIGLATLEEVFLNIVNNAETEIATTIESMHLVTFPSGDSVSVPVGAKHAKIPESETPQNPRGLMVEVYWQRNDRGNLCIAGLSPEMPVPDSFPTLPFSTANSSGNV
ncbi:ABC transporter A family member 2-like [Henckelia pumila]|uniref:ABC transporter A family member 2-like n=1 Tax=Henckelia pumila TaxID=405737 RepID=UPI003C6DDFDB